MAQHSSSMLGVIDPRYGPGVAKYGSWYNRDPIKNPAKKTLYTIHSHANLETHPTIIYHTQ